MGNHGKFSVPPNQYKKLKKMYPHLKPGWPIKVQWARIMKATKGPLYQVRLELEVKNGPKKNPMQGTRSKSNQKKVASLAISKFPPNPTYVPSFQGYNNPMPSTSTWPYETVPSVVRRDPLQLGCPIPKKSYKQYPILSTYEVDASSDTSGSYYSPDASKSYYSPETTSGSYYSPETTSGNQYSPVTEPVSPSSSETEVSDALSQVMKASNLGPQTNTKPFVWPIVSASVVPVARVSPVPRALEPVARVDPVPLVLEPVAPVVSPTQRIYNPQNDPEIEVIMQMGPQPTVEPPELEIILELPPRPRQTPVTQMQERPSYRAKTHRKE